MRHTHPPDKAMTTYRILIADDDLVYRERLSRSFRTMGHETAVAADCHEAIAIARDFQPDAAILDLRMPGPDGLACLKSLLATYPQMKAIILTGYGSIASAIEAVRAGATDYLTKPADAEEILAKLNGETSIQPGTTAPSLDMLEWEHIQRVLHDNDGNITHAAEALGMHRRSLQRKLQKFAPNR